MKRKPLRLRMLTGERAGLGRSIEVVVTVSGETEPLAWWDYKLRQWMLFSPVLLCLVRAAMEGGKLSVAASIKGTARQWLKRREVVK